MAHIQSRQFPRGSVNLIMHSLYLRDTIVVLDMLSVRAKKRSILKEFRPEFLQLFVEYCVLLGSISILAYLRLNSREFIPSAGLSKESVELLLDVSEPLKLNTVKTKPRQVEKYCPMQYKRMHAIECRLLQHQE